MKGIVLAGGSGTRLYPLTIGVSKQLLPVYSKPMIYYPLAALMMAGIRDLLVITTPEDASAFMRVLGDGKQWGLTLSYAQQAKPEGIAQAFIVGEKFIGEDSVALVLGDNIFFGHDFPQLLREGAAIEDGALVFAYNVRDPGRYGVAEIDGHGNVLSIEEKPAQPKSNFAVTGLYFYDNDVVRIAKSLKPSARGELEITDINSHYLNAGKLKCKVMRRGMAWLDIGTHESLVDAINFVKTIEDRQGLFVYSPEEVAYRMKFITKDDLRKLAEPLQQTEYGKYLMKLANGKSFG